MKFLWTSLCIVGAIASAIPYTSAHEVHLPYLPSLEPENPTNTYLVSGINWYLNIIITDIYFICLVHKMDHQRWFALCQ